jgi:hypothetical protein
MIVSFLTLFVIACFYAQDPKTGAAAGMQASNEMQDNRYM